jgi:hypothetical protein
MSEDETVEFAEELFELIIKYQFKMSNAEVLGILKLMADDISDKTRNDWRGPSEFS